MGIVVLIPTYNEEGNIKPLLSRIESVRQFVGENLKVLIINEGQPCSGERFQVRFLNSSSVLLLNRNGQRGLGAAYMDGLRYAVAHLQPSIIVQMDGDLQHPPESIPNLARGVKVGYDVVIASRYAKPNINSGWYSGRYIVSRLTNLVLAKFLRLGVNDATSGFRALSRPAVEAILSDGITARGFGFQVETLCMIKNKGMKIEEIPFSIGRRVNGRSKLLLTNPLDFIKCVMLSRLKRSNSTASQRGSSSPSPA